MCHPVSPHPSLNKNSNVPPCQSPPLSQQKLQCATLSVPTPLSTKTPMCHPVIPHPFSTKTPTCHPVSSHSSFNETWDVPSFHESPPTSNCSYPAKKSKVLLCQSPLPSHPQLQCDLPVIQCDLPVMSAHPDSHKSKHASLSFHIPLPPLNLRCTSPPTHPDVPLCYSTLNPFPCSTFSLE